MSHGTAPHTRTDHRGDDLHRDVQKYRHPMIFPAIAIPSLLKARASANESAAIGDCRTVISAQHAYASANGGFFDSLECLAFPTSCIPNYPVNAPQFLDEETAGASVKSAGKSSKKNIRNGLMAARHMVPSGGVTVPAGGKIKSISIPRHRTSVSTPAARVTTTSKGCRAGDFVISCGACIMLLPACHRR